MARELFEALETAVAESVETSQSVWKAVTNLRSAWCIAEPDCYIGKGKSFEKWALENIDRKIWLYAMSLSYNADKRIKARLAIQTMSTSLQISPSQLYSAIGVHVLSSERGIGSLKVMIELLKGELEPMVLRLEEARWERLGGGTNRKRKEVHFTVSDVKDAIKLKTSQAAKLAKSAKAAAESAKVADQAAVAKAADQAAGHMAEKVAAAKSQSQAAVAKAAEQVSEKVAEKVAAANARSEATGKSAEQVAAATARSHATGHLAEQAAEQVAAAKARNQATGQSAEQAAVGKAAEQVAAAPARIQATEQAAAAAAKARAETDTTWNTLEMAKRKLCEGLNATYKRSKPFQRASSVPPTSTSAYTEEPATTAGAQPTQSKAKCPNGLHPAQTLQDALFNDERRHALLRAYRIINIEAPNTHLARVGQLAIHIFEFGRPARVWTAGGKESEHVGLGTTVSIHGGCDCSYDDADILLLTEAEHAIWAANNNDPKLVVIRDQEFIKRRPAQTTQDWLKEMDVDVDLSPRPIKIDVQLLGKDANEMSVENMAMQDALTLWKNADTSPEICREFPPVNFLNISNPRFTCWPEGITKHYGLLRQAVGYCESVKYSQNRNTEINIGKPTSLPYSPVDIQKCAEFSIAAQRGAVSGWHMDQNGVTTFLTLESNKPKSKPGDEVKYWPFFPMDHYGVEEQGIFRDEFKKYGEQWRPMLRGSKIPVIALVRGDTLVQPPGTIHAPITLTNCKLTGGMAWRERDMKRSMEEWLFLADNEGCTNEPLPQQTSEIINYLQPRVRFEPEKFGYRREELQMFEDVCKRLVHLAAAGKSCSCSTTCGVRCGCLKKGVPCGPECHNGARRNCHSSVSNFRPSSPSLS
ncbi:hypothetical protein V493_00893 [Pseudogymnoascus sp. VKM F-4281 (FW-2241)]|nr:hypothetical protein V493_00893 [Pseudogymnoascus sp. VKM F-4281 (FW-2241)]